jgi:DNA polymerase-3 subunit alpha
LIAEREKNGAYKDVFDVVCRQSARTVNKKTLESLVMSGAFDSFGAMHRAQFIEVPPGENLSNLDKIIRFGQQVGTDAAVTHSLFNDIGMPDIPLPKMHTTKEWTLSEKLKREKELVGIYISAHPLDTFQFEMQHYHFIPLSEIHQEHLKNKPLRVAGYIASADHLTSKKGTLWGKIKLVDYSGEHDFSFFGEQYLRFREMLVQDNKVMMTVCHQHSKWDENKFEWTTQQIMLLEEVKSVLTKRLNVVVELDRLDAAFTAFLKKHAETSGKCELGIQVVDKENNQVVRLLTQQRKIKLSDDFIHELTGLQHISYSIVVN